VGEYEDAYRLNHGFLYDQGSYTTLDVPGSTGGTEARGTNNFGQIVGGNWLYSAGSYTTLDVPGSTGTTASGINGSGQIVGWYDDAAGRHGFLATPVP
jgi:uncharacterized membrane protein